MSLSRTVGLNTGWKPGGAVRCCASISASRPPARVGDRVEDVDTPALLIDLDAFERNCKKLRSVMAGFPGVAIRPHCKAHKSGDVAKLQLQLLGASGVCCQKVAEAEAVAEAGGVLDILLSNEVVAAKKINRLVGLAKQGVKIEMCFESVENLRQINAEAARQGTHVDVLVELNVGQDRCGVDSPSEVVDLARQAMALDSVRFTGIQAYHGGLQHVRQPGDRAQRVGQVVARAEAAVNALKAAGLPCLRVTGGGTGTYRIEAASGVFTEVQPGSFCLGDADYARNVQEDGSVGEWEQSLWVLTQVMSRSPARGLAVFDAGTKAVSLDSGPPLLPPSYSHGVQMEFQSGGDEHGKLLWPQGAYQLPADGELLPAVGQLLRLQPGHCDPTVNLYDWVVGVRGDQVEVVWPIRGRGPGQ